MLLTLPAVFTVKMTTAGSNHLLSAVILKTDAALDLSTPGKDFFCQMDATANLIIVHVQSGTHHGNPTATSDQSPLLGIIRIKMKITAILESATA
jgi:hypothetical protein